MLARGLVPTQIGVTGSPARPNGRRSVGSRIPGISERRSGAGLSGMSDSEPGADSTAATGVGAEDRARTGLSPQFRCGQTIGGGADHELIKVAAGEAERRDLRDG